MNGLGLILLLLALFAPVPSQAQDSDGNLFLVDVATGNSRWTAITEGQIRYIQWDTDDSRFYVSSGSGFLDAYDITGKRLWRTIRTPGRCGSISRRTTS